MAIARVPPWMILAFAPWLASPSQAAEPLTLREFRETHLAVPIDFRVYATTEASANAAARAAYARIDELNRIFSDYEEESEARRLCRADGPIKVSPELFFLLERSLALSAETDGAFDITVGPLIKQWRRARRQKTLPTPDQIAAAQAVIGYRNLKLNAADQTAQVLKPGMQLDFGGIAKGYVAEEAYKVLAAHGCPRSLVAVAGDIYAGDAPPNAPLGRSASLRSTNPTAPPANFSPSNANRLPLPVTPSNTWKSTASAIRTSSTRKPASA